MDSTHHHRLTRSASRSSMNLTTGMKLCLIIITIVKYNYVFRQSIGAI